MTPALAADAAEVPEDIIVTGSVYRGEVASGGARIDVDTRDLPLSISVVTEALIDDRQVRNLRELSENVAGVRSRANGSGAFTIDFTVRGLQTFGQNIALNGFRVENFDAGFDPQAVERVEFLKGPASVLYGASGALSGLVNIVTKVPKPDNFLTMDVTGGVPAYGRTTIDGNVQVAQGLDARINAAVTSEKALNAFRDISEQFVSPAIRWHPGERFSLLLEASYFHAVEPTRGVRNYPGDFRFARLSRRFKTGEPYDRNENTGYNLHGEARYEIADGLTLRQGVNRQHYEADSIDVRIEGLSGPDTIERSASRGSSGVTYLVSQSEVRWNFSVAGMKHTFLAGFEYSDAKFGGICCDSARIAPLDLDNPVYGDPQPMLGLTEYFNNTVRANAFYAQDFIEIGQFKVLAGIRYDDTKSTSGFCSLLTPGCPTDPVVANLGSAKETALTPRFGAVWQPSDRTTLHASYAKSFNPNVALDRNNKLLPPERGTQYEIGVRQELAEPGRLLASIAAFQIKRQNIADCDPLFLDCSRSIAIGAQRIRGVEVELTGKPAEWLDLVATYAYIDGKVTKSDEAVSGIAVGSRLPEAAPHSASLFAKAGLDPLGVRGVAVSAGVYYVAKRPGRDFFGAFSGGPFADPIAKLPASTRLDLGAYWDVTDVFRLQANVTNVFDVKVFEPVNIGFNLTQRRRATIGGTVKF
jgi:iron complex outermembrane receptor protein